jgi:hypothetical protein
MRLETTQRPITWQWSTVWASLPTLTKQPKFSAPAWVHRSPSALIYSVSMLIGICAPLKTRALRCFQISQVTRTSKVSKPFLFGPFQWLLALLNQSCSDSLQVWELYWPPIAIKISVHIWSVKERKMDKWSHDSGSWSHRGSMYAATMSSRPWRRWLEGQPEE